MADEAVSTSAEPGVDATAATAPPGEAAASTPDSAPADPKAVPSEKETAFLRNLRAQERRLVEEKQRFAVERNSTKAERDALAAQRAEFERERASARERDELLRRDPLDYATRHLGFRDEDLARRWVSGKQSPQELEHQREQVFQAELRKRDAEIEAIKARDVERTKAEQAAAAHAATQAAIGRFTELAKSKAAEFPLAARLLETDRAEFLDDADRIASSMARTGQWRGPDSFNEVLSRIETKYGKVTGAKAPAAQAATQGSEQADPQGTRVDPKTAPTLTGKTASQRSAADAEDDPLLDVLDRDKGRKRAMKAIEKAEAEAKAARH